MLVQKRAVTGSNSRPNTSTSATFDQTDQTSDGVSLDGATPGQNRNERSPVLSFHLKLSYSFEENISDTLRSTSFEFIAYIP